MSDFEPTKIDSDEPTYELRRAYRMARAKNVARVLRSASKVALAAAQRMEATDRLSSSLDYETLQSLQADMEARTKYIAELAVWALRTQETQGDVGMAIYELPKGHEYDCYEH